MNKTISDDRYLRLLGWLRAERLKQGVSVRELGNRLNESNSFVTKTELAERRLDILEYVAYCKALELDPKAGLKMLE